jgi:hypothetical protein
MRSLCITTIAAGLMFAPMAWAQPLAPGKAAGVHAAKHGASTGLLVMGTALVAGLVVLAMSTGGNNNTGLAVPIAPGTTS